jgi:ubiquinone/menaquinone biosynthesis C-methylase UbiE
VLEEDRLREYWDRVALEAKQEETQSIKKWRRAARNWLAEYADCRARDLVLEVVENVVKLKSSARVLDVGCGPGKWTRLFAKKCSAVTAIDLSPRMITLAKNSLGKEAGNVDFHVMNVSKLRFPDNKYDLVNCVTVLQHILDDEEWEFAVNEIVRVTRPGGKVLLYENAPNLVVVRRTPHLHVKSMKYYSREFEKHGANMIYWRAADLSLPITFFGLRDYAASFNNRVYYFADGGASAFSDFLSLLSRMAVVLAKPLDYKLGETSLGFLSVGKIMLFEKIT